MKLSNKHWVIWEPGGALQVSEGGRQWKMEEWTRRSAWEDCARQKGAQKGVNQEEKFDQRLGRCAVQLTFFHKTISAAISSYNCPDFKILWNLRKYATSYFDGRLGHSINTKGNVPRVEDKQFRLLHGIFYIVSEQSQRIAALKLYMHINLFCRLK